MITPEECEARLLVQLTDFFGKTGHFQKLPVRTSEIERACILTKTVFSPLRVWPMFQEEAPEFSAVASAILKISPSEAAVERIFAAQNDVHSAERSLLSDDLIAAEMRIKCNSNPLRKLIASAVEEMSDADE